jgi:hypothetical protein
MPTVFNAASVLEAHLVADLLGRSSIESRIDGEYLAGGIGDLPVAGLVRVVVEERDLELAKSIIAQWESGAFQLPDDAPVGKEED